MKDVRVTELFLEDIIVILDAGYLILDRQGPGQEVYPRPRNGLDSCLRRNDGSYGNEPRDCSSIYNRRNTLILGTLGISFEPISLE